MDRKMVSFIKEQYPSGTRIRLNSMEDPYAPIAPGTEGVVDFVDDIGTIHMKWDNGRSLGIVPGEDSFSVLPPKLTTFKLYMPLTAELYERSVYGDLEAESTELDGSALRSYQDQIMAELVKNRMPEETERGLMHWYGKADSINTKVHSAVFTVEEHDRQLWGVAECRVAGELSAAELDTLKKYITGQAADGWGEHFEQCEILVDGGSELYADILRGRSGVSVRPRILCWENVPGAFSSGEPHGEDFRIVLEEIIKICVPDIYVPRPHAGKFQSAGWIRVGDTLSVGWRVADAQHWGVPQRRARIFLVADFGGLTAPKILFKPESLPGYTAPSEGSWKTAAEKIGSCFAGAGGLE